MQTPEPVQPRLLMVDPRDILRLEYADCTVAVGFQLVQRNADLAASARLWANWCERALERANHVPTALATAPRESS